jgi:isopenicillin N synthase-like dioxygenase
MENTCSIENIVSSLISNSWVSIVVPEAIGNHFWHNAFENVFALPMEAKIAAGKYRACQGMFVGYKADDEREFIECHRLSNRSLSPHFQDQYEHCVSHLYDSLSSFAILILEAISFRLGLHPDLFVDLTDLKSCGVLPERPLSKNVDPCFQIDDDLQQSLSSSVIRVCRYESSRDAMQSFPIIRFGAHTDTSFLTIAPHSFTPGLEIFDASAREWICPERNFPHHNVTVFVGEFLQVLTRHRIKAAVHRVTSFGPEPRISCPFIIRGRSSAVIEFKKYAHPVDLDEASVPDLDGTPMRVVHKLLDLKRSKCARDHANADDEDWILCSYPETYCDLK